MPEERLTVAVTGPTGTFGAALVPLLQVEPRVGRIVGIARRPFDPSASGWTKMEYRRGDVRDEAALREAFADADVVVHLAFMLTGNAWPATIRAINIDGTLGAFRAARACAAARFVYASSLAAYGFHPDNPVGMTEAWPTRPARRLFYAREKAELEQLLAQHATEAPLPALYVLRPPIVLGPSSVGARGAVPAPLAGVGWRALALLRRLPIPIPAPAPDMPIQLIHQDDLGQALLTCVLGDGPPGAYNIAADGVLTGVDVARELGLSPIPIPRRAVETAARLASAVPPPPFLPPSVEWVEAASHPAIADTTKARRELGFSPRYSALEALRATIRSR